MFNGKLIGPIFCPPGTGGGGSLSGFAGVISIESLSGIIDIDSFNNSININTSGQVINLTINQSYINSLFSGFIPVDARPVSGSIVPDTSGVYAIGAPSLRFSHIFAQSGIFGLGKFDILTNQPQQIDNGSFWLRQQSQSQYRFQYQTPSGVRTIRTTDGYGYFIKSTTDDFFGTSFISIYFDTASVIDSQYYSQSGGSYILHVWANGLYKITYNMIIEYTDPEGTGGDAIVQGRIWRNNSSSIDGSESFDSVTNTSTLRFGQLNKSVYVNLNAGDTIELQAQLVTGLGVGAVYEDSSFSIEYIRV